MDFKLLALLPLLIFLPHISFCCKNPIEVVDDAVDLLTHLPPCTFGDGDPGEDKDIPIARQMLSPQSSK